METVKKLSTLVKTADSIERIDRLEYNLYCGGQKITAKIKVGSALNAVLDVYMNNRGWHTEISMSKEIKQLFRELSQEEFDRRDREYSQAKFTAKSFWDAV